MKLLSPAISRLARLRLRLIELWTSQPVAAQREVLQELVTAAQYTEFGRRYKFNHLFSLKTFKQTVPVHEYDDLKPYIQRMMNGEENILWNTPIEWFAKSSGTTSDKSKFIPVSEEALEECHFKGGKDLLSIYCNNNPDSQIFSGKVLGLGGSITVDDEHAETFHGDVSAIIMENLPYWVELIRTPEISVALMNEWESKIERIALITKDEDVTNISGVPSWTLLLLKRILEITGKKNIGEVWPNLELFIHGGVNFSPYHEQFSKIAPAGMKYLETYNASEGFFGIQDLNTPGEMLLMLDYGIFYEFMPLSEYDVLTDKTVSLDKVETGVNYALVISTNAGLWRYIIGDTIQFTSLDPYRIRITGRTTSFINACGEELIIDNAEKAIATACEKASATITDYTAAPVYFNDHTNAAHEWLIEFATPPESLDYFAEILDNALKALNSDYEAKRYHNMILRQPIIKQLPAGTFYRWLKERGKLGGQNKVPRLSNDRKYLDDIKELAGIL